MRRIAYEYTAEPDSPSAERLGADGRPNASNSNYVPDQTIPNFAVVRADANGDVCFYTTAAAHLIWDQVAVTTAITATNANRLLDTRL